MTTSLVALIHALTSVHTISPLPRNLRFMHHPQYVQSNPFPTTPTLTLTCRSVFYGQRTPGGRTVVQLRRECPFVGEGRLGRGDAF